MTTDSSLGNSSLEVTRAFNHWYLAKDRYVLWSDRYFAKEGRRVGSDWQVNIAITPRVNAEPVYSAAYPYIEWHTRLQELRKLEERYQEQLAGVWLDDDAQRLLSALDRETSIPWEELQDRTGVASIDLFRSAARLAAANLCDVSFTQCSLSEYGDKLLIDLSQRGQLPLPFAS